MLAIGLDPFKCKINPKQILESTVNFMELGDGLEAAIEKRSNIPKDKVIYAWDEILYCTCRQPDDGTRYVKCKVCSKWFHQKCENISEDVNEWICKYCPDSEDTHINLLPIEILQKVFIILCLDKEEMHQTLAMVCKKWAYIVDTEEFRAAVQRAHLDVYYDAKNWPQQQKDLFYYSGFNIVQCRYCGDFFKERLGYYRDPFSRSTNYYPPDESDEKLYCRPCAPFRCSYEYNYSDNENDDNDDDDRD